jgi:hypothetical protein
MVGRRKIYEYVAPGRIAQEIPFEGCAVQLHDLQRTFARAMFYWREKRVLGAA